MSEANLPDGDAQRLTIAYLGPSTCGSYVFFVLFGLYIAQHARYASGPSYRRLSRNVKATLWLVCFLTTVYAGVLFADSLYWTLTVKRSPDEIVLGVNLDAAVPIFDALVAVPVQVLLAIRATILIQRPAVRRTFLAFTGFTILVSFTGAIMSCATTLMYLNDTIDNIAPFSYNTATAMWLWPAAIADILISACLWSTLRQRIQGYDHRTDSLLRMLMHTTLKTAAYTSIMALAGAAVATATDDVSTYSLVPWAFFVPLPACYALSLYTTMSSRKEIEHYLYPTPTATPSMQRSMQQRSNAGQGEGPGQGPAGTQHSLAAAAAQPDLPLPNADPLTLAALATKTSNGTTGRGGVIKWRKEELEYVPAGELVGAQVGGGGEVVVPTLTGDGLVLVDEDEDGEGIDVARRRYDLV